MDDWLGTYAWQNTGNDRLVAKAGKRLASPLQVFGNMRLGQDERLYGDSDDPFVRPASCARGQLALNLGGDVSSNNGEVAVFKFENIRTALQRRGLCAAQMRIGTESTQRHVDNMRRVGLVVKPPRLPRMSKRMLSM